MSTLFGSAATAASSASTSGDLSKDIALADPPSDSVSDLSFSPTANFLAVASWDKKVRIYEVGEDGKSEGRAAIDFEAPALACAWSNVSSNQRLLPSTITNDFRMAQKSWESAPTKTFACSIWVPNRLPISSHTINPSELPNLLRSTAIHTSSQDHGTRKSSIGISDPPTQSQHLTVKTESILWTSETNFS